MSQTYTPGRYRARMNSAALGSSNNKGTPQIAFSFTPIGFYGPSGTIETCAADDRTIFRYISDGTIDYLIQELAALGFNRDSFSEIDSDHPNAFPWAGVEFDCRLGYEEFEGKEKERWEFARGAPKGKPIEDQKVRELDAKYGAYLKGRSVPTNGAKPVKPAAAAAATNSDADIPF